MFRKPQIRICSDKTEINKILEKITILDGIRKTQVIDYIQNGPNSKSNSKSKKCCLFHHKPQCSNSRCFERHHFTYRDPRQNSKHPKKHKKKLLKLLLLYNHHRVISKFQKKTLTPEDKFGHVTIFLEEFEETLVFQKTLE